jgi:DNA replication and repair protein RecF
MHIKSLAVNCFRNLSSLQIEFTEGVNIFGGDNGSGKTNLLEAIHVLCLGRSQRGAGDQVLLKQDSDFYRLQGQLASDDALFEVTTAYQQGGRKKLTIDGLTARLSELYNRVGVVSAGPEDSAIVAGSPSQRRTFMDIYISQLTVRYLSDLSDYQRALMQKNAALKAERDTSPFDSILVSLGSRIMLQRSQFLSRLGELAGLYHQRLSGGEHLAALYRPSVDFDQQQADLADIAACMEVKLIEMQRREEAMQTAVVGPHRDDIYFAVNNLPARSHGSQGQWRSVSIALKLAVYQLLKERREQTPILLLDEVFAELDAKRAAALIGAFSEFGQLFLTTALAPPEQLKRQGNSYRMQNGTLAVDG